MNWNLTTILENFRERGHVNLKVWGYTSFNQAQQYVYMKLHWTGKTHLAPCI